MTRQGRSGKTTHIPHELEFTNLVDKEVTATTLVVDRAPENDSERPDSVVEEAVPPARSLQKNAVLHESDDTMVTSTSTSSSDLATPSAVLETSDTSHTKAVSNPVTTPPIEIDPVAAKDIATAVEKAPATGSTQLYHLKTSFKPHLMKPNTKMKAQDCYGIAVQKNEAETTVSMYHCPAVKGTCPSSLSDKCTVTEITRIPTSIDLSKSVEETLLMRY